jgi:hypothetical protein
MVAVEKKMTRKELIDYCSLDTSDCWPADVDWIKSTPGTVRHLWETCPRVGLLLWLAQHSPDFNPIAYTALVNLKTQDRQALRADYDVECFLLKQQLEIALSRAEETGQVPLPMRTRNDLMSRYGAEPAGSLFNREVAKLNRRYNKKLANAIRSGVSWGAVEDALHYFSAP